MELSYPASPSFATCGGATEFFLSSIFRTRHTRLEEPLLRKHPRDLPEVIVGNLTPEPEAAVETDFGGPGILCVEQV